MCKLRARDLACIGRISMKISASKGYSWGENPQRVPHHLHVGSNDGERGNNPNRSSIPKKYHIRKPKSRRPRPTAGAQELPPVIRFRWEFLPDRGTARRIGGCSGPACAVQDRAFCVLEFVPASVIVVLAAA
jgi:hypothetical protein